MGSKGEDLDINMMRVVPYPILHQCHNANYRKNIANIQCHFLLCDQKYINCLITYLKLCDATVNVKSQMSFIYMRLMM